MSSNNHKNTCIRPDSIASAVDTDLESLLNHDPGPFRSAKCPMHKKGLPSKIIQIPSDTSQPIVQVSRGPKLKGILKGAKNNITTNPILNSRESSVTSACSESPPPLTDATLPAVHISKAPKPPLRTSSSMNSKNVSEALHV